MIARLSVRALFVGLAALSASPGRAQPTIDSLPAAVDPAEPGKAPLERAISFPAAHLPLREALALLSARAGAPIHPIWADDLHADGLRPETPIDIPAARTSVLRVLDLVLHQCDPGIGGGATWQRSEDGAIEVGTRASLNEHPTLYAYDVRDLLHTPPDFTDGATLDLQAALEARAGGGSVLRDGDRPIDLGAESRSDLERDLVDLITATIEPEQWADNGGRSTIRRYRDVLIVVAPEYIHRRLR